MSPRAVIVLGIGQCVNWGVLYYAFAVLVVPLRRELGVPTWAVTAALSLALLTSAAAAPLVGRWADRGRGGLVMQAGGFTAAALLVVWTFVPGVLSLYAVWAGLGLCMAASLYEPAFAIVGRAYGEPVGRLRALAAVTLFGGLASSVFLPATALLVDWLDWRGAVLVLAAILTGATVATRQLVFRRGHPAEPGSTLAHADPDVAGPVSVGLPFAFVTITFVLASFASAALTANLVPALGERGIAPAAAAVLGGSIGVAQLPGRALLMSGALGGAPSRLLVASLLLQAAGLGGIVLGASLPLAAGGILAFALGAGLTTLVRPHLIQTMFSRGRGGYLNGRVARHQQLARAAGPLVVAWLAGPAGYAAVFAVIAGLFTLAAVLASPGVLDRINRGLRQGGEMTEPTSRQQTTGTGTPAACCDSQVLQSCCEPEAKTACCGSDPTPGACGCSSRRQEVAAGPA